MFITESIFKNREFKFPPVSVHFSHSCRVMSESRSVLSGKFAGEENEMADESLSGARYGEAFWRAHHEAWHRSDLNQREYCEAQAIRSRRSATGGPSSKQNRSCRRASCSIDVAA
jgi:hypothetical protein